MVHGSEFLRLYRPDVAVTFHCEGQDAQWASPAGGPRVWGDEDEIITLDTSDGLEDGRTRSAMAVSPDGRLLATTASSVIQIFGVKTRKLLSELKGHPNGIPKLVFAPLDPEDVAKEMTDRYTLLSNGTNEKQRRDTIIAWSLDGNGCQVAATPFTPFETDRRTETAMASIANDLQQEHGVTEAETESIRAAIHTVIDGIEKQHRLKTLPYVSGGLPHYNDTELLSFNEHGLRVLYLIENVTTQRGMRPPEKLPQIVIAALREPKTSTGGSGDNGMSEDNSQLLQTIQKLRGHTDNILSVSFSPDGKLVASASWDETFRIWSVETGECLHRIGPTGNQNWVVAFTPTNDRVLLSGGGGRDKPSPLAQHNTNTGEEVSRLRYPDLKSWLRTIAIHPDGKSAVVANGASLLLWDLTEENKSSHGDEELPNNAVEILKLGCPDQETDAAQARVFRLFASFLDLSWVDGGRKLLVRASDCTVFVWDREQNVHWRFQRPDDMENLGFGSGLAYVDEGERGTVVSLDGDGKVRFWKL